MSQFTYDEWVGKVKAQKEHAAEALKRKEEHKAECMVGYADCAECRKLSTNHAYDIGDLKVLVRKFQRAYPLGR